MLVDLFRSPQAPSISAKGTWRVTSVRVCRLASAGRPTESLDCLDEPAVPNEQEVATYLKVEFAADAAIVVGSRADNTARAQSDWDCYVLVENGNGSRGARPEPRELLGASLDVGVVSLPIDAKDVFQVFGPNLQQARVLFDTRDQAAKRIIEVAAQVYASGRHLSEQEITVRARQMARNIDKTIARQDQAGAFFEAITFVFYIAHRHWYEVLHKRFSQSVYRAMPEIERADPEFYGLLLVLTSSDSAEAKIRAAQHLYGRLLGTPPVPQGM